MPAWQKKLIEEGKLPAPGGAPAASPQERTPAPAENRAPGKLPPPPGRGQAPPHSSPASNPAAARPAFGASFGVRAPSAPMGAHAGAGSARAPSTSPAGGRGSAPSALGTASGRHRVEVPSPAEASARTAAAAPRTGGDDIPPCAWTEHKAPDGRKYYYNKSLKKSVWVKPPEFVAWEKKKEEIARNKAAPVPAPAPQTPWKEYTAPDGRKYYYNRVTKKSVWQKPDELKAAEAAAASAGGVVQPRAGPPGTTAAAAPANAPAAAANLARGAPGPAGAAPGAAPVAGGFPGPGMLPPPGMGIPPPGAVPPAAANAGPPAAHPSVLGAPAPGVAPAVGAPAVVAPSPGAAAAGPTDGQRSPRLRSWKTNADRRKVYIQMLEDMEIKEEDLTFEEAMPRMLRDERYQAVTKASEKRSLFAEFMARRRREIAEERRAAARAAQDAFRKMLQDRTDIKPWMRFRDVLRVLEIEPTYRALRASEAEGLFEAHVRSLGAAEREKEAETKRGIRERLLEAFVALRPRDWSDARRVLEDAAGGKPRTGEASTATQEDLDKAGAAAQEAFDVLDAADRLEVFEDYLRRSASEEEERLERERKVEHRSHREARDAFRAVLARLREQGAITAQTTWSTVLPHVKSTREYRDVCEQPGSTPRELFDDAVREAEKEYDAERSIVRSALKKAGTRIEPSSTVDDVIRAVGKVDAVSAIDRERLNTVVFILRRRAARHAAEDAYEVAKRAERANKDFTAMLERYAHRIPEDALYEGAEAELKRHSAYEDVDDKARRELFAQFQASRASAGSRKRSRSPSRSRSRSPSRSRSHSRRHSRSRRERSRDSGDRRSKRARHG